ncbi:TPA: hypothetical protein HA338_04815 [Methanosarcina acetivorans]|uniref:Uncharacterized protein n=1 Tax=Methanosarcina acetivorans TaxID=2214 RepID=A0A832SA57_9EURY|nr:hypothetical protein [Methanosarcina acetivorans]HIH93374.1 hypothetical protein [Methanosarcina acetivorans]
MSGSRETGSKPSSFLQILLVHRNSKTVMDSYRGCNNPEVVAGKCRRTQGNVSC